MPRYFADFRDIAGLSFFNVLRSSPIFAATDILSAFFFFRCRHFALRLFRDDTMPRAL